MNLKEYQNAARSTAIYLKVKSSRMIYPALGLVGECGEVAEKIKKMIRDDDSEVTPENREAIKKELGDVMWYVANICCDIDWELESVYTDSEATRRIREVTTLILPRLVLKMNRHASRAASELEQWYYVYQCSSTESNRFRDIRGHLSYVVCCVEEMAFRFGSTLEGVYVDNIDKLLSRTKRGKMSGSGDNR